MYHWLFLNLGLDDAKVFFQKAPLNVNSNVRLAVSENDNTSIIYDVYNAAFMHGGILNITNVGHFNQRDGYIIKKSTNKYWIRKNMTSVTFKSAIVVKYAVVFEILKNFHYLLGV